MLHFPPRRILVPFDFSAESMIAWRHARDWHLRFNCPVELLYVENLLPAAGVAGWEYAAARLTAGQKTEIKAHLREKLGRLPTVHIAEGDPVVNILHLARTRRPDLIVMGTHGRGGFERFWLGSVAEAVVRRSPVPVLIARRDPRPVMDILAPVNFTTYSEYGLAYAATAAAALKTGLTAFHVCVDIRKCPNPIFRLSTLLDRLPATARAKSVEAKNPTQAILKEAGEHGLVVLVAHRRSFKELFVGTTAEKVLRASSTPVLVVPSPRRKVALEKRIHGRAVV
jgi:nucleotide-binding universal stress UspA family protein